MPWSKAYTRIVWENDPSTDTPLNATNLNLMDAAINELDNRILLLEGSAYVHIKYSAVAAPTNLQMSDTPNAYMGVCVTSSETVPTDATAYTWNRVRGEKVQLQSNGTYIQWKYESDASWTNLVALASLKGDKGDTGNTGAAATIAVGTTTTGAAGTNASVTNSGTSSAAVFNFTIPRGNTGAAGADGREIELQKTSTYVQWRYTDGAWTNLIPLTDLKGDTGATGAGLEFTWNGTQLGVRVVGSPSYTYVDLKGATGTKGDTGNTGRGITSIARTSGTGAAGTTDTYTVTYSDSTTSTFTVYNGADGQGSGDMLKNVYDTDNDGVVDNASKLGGQAPAYYAPASTVPTTLAALTGDSTHRTVTDTEKSTWNGKLGTSGDGSSVTAAFSAAGTRANIATGETHATLFGKLAKWFADLKAVAWSGAYSDLSGTPSLGSLAAKSAVATDDITDANVTNAKLANMNAKTVKGNLGTSAAAPSDVAMLDVTEYGLDAGTVATTVADAEYVPISVSATSQKKITWANIKTALGLIFAALSHTHGNVTNDGKIGSTANLPVFTGISGALQAVTAAAALTNLGAVPLSGETMTGKLYAQANTDYTTYQMRNIALSTTAAVPTGTGSLLGVYT